MNKEVLKRFSWNRPLTCEIMSVMKSHRINVLGGSGSGTSTIGRLLATELQVPHFDSDYYFHKPSDPPFQEMRTPSERCDRLRNDLAASAGWILSGGLVGWDPCPELDFTLVVFLWVPTPIRIERLRKRERERFGARVSLGGDMNETHKNFLDWAAKYDEGDIEGKTLQRHEEHLRALRCPVIEFRGERDTADLLSAILKATA
ncbi:MAG: adenylate kinase family enzyme [Planctomycetota bacterium]|jgi:adenylate kinase family enzyme